MEESWLTIAIVVLAFPAMIAGLRLIAWWAAKKQGTTDNKESDS